MGRRAKNKQGAPEPLGGPRTDARAERPSAKKLGKRKAEAEDGRRPAKKMRESDSGQKGKAQAQTKMKTKVGEVKEVQRPKKAQKGAAAPPATKRKLVDEQEDEDEEEEEGTAGASSDGWEDVEDEADLKKEAKCVIQSLRWIIAANTPFAGRCSTTATMRNLLGLRAISRTTPWKTSRKTSEDLATCTAPLLTNEFAAMIC